VPSRSGPASGTLNIASRHAQGRPASGRSSRRRGVFFGGWRISPPTATVTAGPAAMAPAGVRATANDETPFATDPAGIKSAAVQTAAGEPAPERRRQFASGIWLTKDRPAEQPSCDGRHRPPLPGPPFVIAYFVDRCIFPAPVLATRTAKNVQNGTVSFSLHSKARD